MVVLYIYSTTMANNFYKRNYIYVCVYINKLIKFYVYAILTYI